MGGCGERHAWLLQAGSTQALLSGREEAGKRGNLARARGQALHHLLHVAPDLPLQRGVCQQGLGRERRHDRYARQIVKMPPKCFHGCAASEQELRRGFSQRHHDLGGDRGDAAQQRLALGSLRAGLLRGEAAEIDIRQGEPHRLDDIGQEIPRLTGNPRAGHDEEEPGPRIAGTVVIRAGRGELREFEFVHSGIPQFLKVSRERLKQQFLFADLNHPKPLYFIRLIHYAQAMLILLAAALLLVITLPQQAFAWGAGIHLQLGMNVLSHLEALEPSVAAIIGSNPFDFLYGTIAADITLGKKFTHYLQHCHRWRIGYKVLEKAQDDSERACAYGYLSHLAADCIAHNYYVPYKVMRSFASLTMKHAYWEMRFENYVEKEIWETGMTVSREHFSKNDLLLQKVLSDTIFSFATNKRIFNSILLVSRLEKWQGILQTLSDSSRFALEESDRDEYMQLAQEAVFDFLNHGEDSRFFRADPTGEKALAASEAVRKNLRLLYRSGKLSKPQAYAEVEELRLKLKEAICEPELLLQILSS